MADLPLLLLPGMAADARLFEGQLAQFPTLRVPSWIDPLPGESLRAYATRFARVVDPGVPCIVGGASFGGVVALNTSQQERKWCGARFTGKPRRFDYPALSHF